MLKVQFVVSACVVRDNPKDICASTSGDGSCLEFLGFSPDKSDFGREICCVDIPKL